MNLTLINKMSAGLGIGCATIFISMAPPVKAQTTSTTWTYCSNEWGNCKLPDTRQVRYGANNKFVYKTFSNSVQCTNSVFGDPAPGVPKQCHYATTTTTTTTTTAPTTTTTTTAPITSTSPTTTNTAPAPTAVTRDALKQPFASNSIWNMPIGSGAVYVPANLSDDPAPGTWTRMPQMDEEHIVLRPDAPSTTINYSSAQWSGANRCAATGGPLLQVPIPSDYIVPSNNENSSAVFLMSDRRTIAQTQPFARCSAGGSATAFVKFSNVDLYGDGRTGAHGGSGLSAIGGSLRIGDLRPGSAGPAHALKVNVYAKQALFKCTASSDCYRWPANNADGYAVGHYGAENSNGNRAMKMGALLALPASLNIAGLGLETEPGKQLAWTLQNYGAYIVDDTWAPQFAFNAENGPDGSFKAQFKADYGVDFEQLTTSTTPWARDVRRLVRALFVVDNNSATSIGGGGTPRQPLAPALQ